MLQLSVKRNIIKLLFYNYRDILAITIAIPCEQYFDKDALLEHGMFIAISHGSKPHH